MKKTKGKKKLLLIIPLIILLVLAISFIGWIVKPAKKMNIAVLDATVPATDGQGVNQTDKRAMWRNSWFCFRCLFWHPILYSPFTAWRIC